VDPIQMKDLQAMLLSAVLGTIVGWERQLGHKPAGLRTHVLVCLGSTMFVLLAPHAMRSFAMTQFDPTRIVHGVVTGVGFLGAGSIIRQEGYVAGLTTAASIWIVSAIGTAVGVHAYMLAIVGTVLTLIVLEWYRWIERRVSPRADSTDTTEES
jgi:putative Mg2+ transporter-C (MgtC) family protein